MHLTYGPHQSSTPTTSPLLLCSSQTVTLLHCQRLLLLVIAPALPQLVSVPPPLNGTTPGATAEYLNRFSGRSLTPGILRHAVGATARLMRRGAAYHRPAALQAAISHSGDGPRPLPYRALEPRGGNEPPHVHGVVHGRRFRFCYCTRHMCASRLIVTPWSWRRHHD